METERACESCLDDRASTFSPHLLRPLLMSACEAAKRSTRASTNLFGVTDAAYIKVVAGCGHFHVMLPFIGDSNAVCAGECTSPPRRHMSSNCQQFQVVGFWLLMNSTAESRPQCPAAIRCHLSVTGSAGAVFVFSCVRRSCRTRNCVAHTFVFSAFFLSFILLRDLLFFALYHSRFLFRSLTIRFLIPSVFFLTSYSAR